MPLITPWPTVPRPVADRLVDLIAQDHSGGVALVGNEGVGKTTLAQMAAERLGLGDPVWVVGTYAQSSVPFGAFGPLLDVQEAGKPAELMAKAAESVLRQANSAPIIVDNARLLDPLSASLVYRLAKEEKARPAGSPVIVTVRSVLRVPQVVSALWDDGLLDRIEIHPMDSAETTALVAATSGGDAATLYRHSAGNPLHLRMLITTDGSDETLAGAIDRYLKQLTPDVRRVLDHLCVFEPLSRADLVALTSEAAVQAAVDAGAIAVHGPLAYASHPLFLEQMAAILDRSEVQRFRTAVAAQLATTPSRTPADRLGRTVIALQGEGPVDNTTVVAAAHEALQLGDIGLAERLARGALERGDNFDARLTLSTALGLQGRGREADAILADVDTSSMSEAQTMAWAMPRAANQFWMLNEPERAVIFLHNVRRQLGEKSSHLTLDALSGTFAMNAGNIRKAVEIADEVLSHDDAPDDAVAWAASADALCSARMGRFDAVAPAIERALGVEHPGILRFTLGLAETSTLLMAAKLDEAEEAARRYTDFAESTQPGRAVGEVLLSQVLLARGDAAAAAELLKPAAATLARTGYS